MTSNCQRFEEICSLYGLYCAYCSDKRGRVTGVLVVKESPRTIWCSPEVLFSIKAKSLRDPDWEKLEALVAEKAVSNLFTGN